jgi:hypothetical protein
MKVMIRSPCLPPWVKVGAAPLRFEALFSVRGISTGLTDGSAAYAFAPGAGNRSSQTLSNRPRLGAASSRRSTNPAAGNPWFDIQEGRSEETFGSDKLVVGVGTKPWAELLADAPLTPMVRADIARLYEAKIDYKPGLSSKQKKYRLARMSYRDFLVNVAQADPGVVPVLQGLAGTQAETGIPQKAELQGQAESVSRAMALGHQLQVGGREGVVADQPGLTIGQPEQTMPFLFRQQVPACHASPLVEGGQPISPGGTYRVRTQRSGPVESNGFAQIPVEAR